MTEDVVKVNGVKVYPKFSNGLTWKEFKERIDRQLANFEIFENINISYIDFGITERELPDAHINNGELEIH